LDAAAIAAMQGGQAMSEEIIARLKSAECYDYGGSGVVVGWLKDDPTEEAADEIERLRARVEVLERACRLIEADPDPNAVVECVACYRHSRLAYHALEAKP
jgi:hypothetical protein